tara:strand:+ start:73 stop:369 length:297 start_codon:yes stop_codon:yes gene_type:complete
MIIANLIPIDVLCVHYQVNDSFFKNLVSTGLLDLHIVEEVTYVHQDSLHEIEKIMRLHQELELNLEGVDVVLNLLQKINDLQNEIVVLKNRLALYENQ